MAEEITILSRSESITNSQPSEKKADRPSQISLPLLLAAFGLCLSFFMPWVQVIGISRTGFDLQSLGDEYQALWLIPLVAAVAVVAAIMKTSERIAALVAGATPIFAAIYYIDKMGEDFLKVLAIGGCFVLGFAIALILIGLLGLRQPR